MEIKQKERVVLTTLISLFVCCFFYSTAYPQIRTIPLETKHHALVFKVNEQNDVLISYFGRRLNRVTEYASVPDTYRQSTDYTGLLNSAYTPSGSRNLVEPAISVTHADGNNSLDLRYVSHEIQQLEDGVSLLKIALKDPVYPFEVSLFYKAYFNDDVVEQWSEIKHEERGTVTLHKFASANLHLKASEYWLRQYYGDWAREMQPEEEK